MNARQHRFVAEYVKCLNATQAAIAAGYAARSARQMAHRLLTKDDVQTEVSRLNSAKLDGAGVDAAWLLRRLVELADLDIGELFDQGGRLRDIHRMSEAARRLISAIEITERTDGRRGGPARVQVTKVRLVDRLRALEDIGKHVAVSAFRETKEDPGVLVTIRDYTGRHSVAQQPAVDAEPVGL